MRTISIWTDCKEISETVSQITMLFPCFVKVSNNEMGFIEVSVKCRQEDASSIERLLSSLV